MQVALPANDAARIKPGDEATLELGEDREIGGRVRSVTPALDPESRSATAIISLAGAVPGVQPGAFLQARIRPSGETDATAISVPEAAVQMVEGTRSCIRSHRNWLPGNARCYRLTLRRTHPH